MLAVSQGKLLQHLYQVPVSTDFLMFPISILRFLFFGIRHESSHQLRAFSTVSSFRPRARLEHCFHINFLTTMLCGWLGYASPFPTTRPQFAFLEFGNFYGSKKPPKHHADLKQPWGRGRTRTGLTLVELLYEGSDYDVLLAADC